MVLVSLIGLPLTILGIIFLKSNSLWIFAILFGPSLFFAGLIAISYLPIVYVPPYREIVRIKETNQNRLFRMVENLLVPSYPFYYFGMYDFKLLLAIAALGDLGSEEAIVVLRQVVRKALNSERRQYRRFLRIAYQALDLIALKRGYESREQLIQKVDAERAQAPGVPISRVYQIDELPSDTRCMVSHLEIHLEMDELVACPYCEGIAKKELLEEWLEKNGTCPVCRRKILIEECFIVQLKSAE